MNEKLKMTNLPKCVIANEVKQSFNLNSLYLMHDK